MRPILDVPRRGLKSSDSQDLPCITSRSQCNGRPGCASSATDGVRGCRLAAEPALVLDALHPQDRLFRRAGKACFDRRTGAVAQSRKSSGGRAAGEQECVLAYVQRRTSVPFCCRIRTRGSCLRRRNSRSPIDLHALKRDPPALAPGLSPCKYIIRASAALPNGRGGRAGGAAEHRRGGRS